MWVSARVCALRARQRMWVCKEQAAVTSEEGSASSWDIPPLSLTVAVASGLPRLQPPANALLQAGRSSSFQTARENVKGGQGECKETLPRVERRRRCFLKRPETPSQPQKTLCRRVSKDMVFCNSPGGP